MISTTINAANAAHDAARVPIPEVLPCQFCGLGLRDADPSSISLLVVEGPMLQNGFRYDADVPVARCPRCGRRRLRAAELLAAFPAVPRAYGDVALDKTDAMLAALDVLGDRRGKLVEQLVTSAQSLYDTIEALAPLGSAAYWARDYARLGAFESRRWERVPAVLVADIRAAHLALLRKPFERSVPVTPPTNALRGCGFCGVGSVVERESDTGSAWGQQLRFPLAVFGAPGDAIVHFCPACRDDLEATGGAIGYPALWRAVVRWRGFTILPGRVVTGISDVEPWAALVGAEPNRERFAHLDAAGLDRMLVASSDVRKLAA